MAALYDAIRAFPPFCRLSLPEAEGVSFAVSKHRDRQGHYIHETGPLTDRHFITLSGRQLGHLDSVAATLAHEMIHLHQAIAKTETRAMHNAEFHAIADRACRRFGWDRKMFVGTE